MVYILLQLIALELAWKRVDRSLNLPRELDCLTDTGREFQILAPEYDEVCLKNPVLGLGTVRLPCVSDLKEYRLFD